MKNTTRILTTLLLIASMWTRATSVTTGTPAERAKAAQELGNPRDASAVADLAKTALDKDEAVAYAAAQALGHIGDDKAAAALLDVLKKDSRPVVIDGALRCAEARLAAGSKDVAAALYTQCLAKGNPAPCGAALAALAQLALDQVKDTVRSYLQGASSVEICAAVEAVRVQPAYAALACEMLPALKEEHQAKLITAMSAHADKAEVRKLVQAALSTGPVAVRKAALYAAVATADKDALPAIFALTLENDPVGIEATRAIKMYAAPETDTFLFEKLAQTDISRIKAIELLSLRRCPDLIDRLCDVDLYTEKGVDKAAATALRSNLGADKFVKVLEFTFIRLPATSRPDFASALAAVIQTLPDQQAAVKAVVPLSTRIDNTAKAELMELLAGVQTKDAYAILSAQLSSDDVELRKATIRILTKWNSPLALEALVAVARNDSDRTCRILALRAVFSQLNKDSGRGGAELKKMLEQLVATADRKEEKLAILSLVRTRLGDDGVDLRKKLCEDCGVEDVEYFVIKAINVGGKATSGFEADQGWHGGKLHSNMSKPDTTGVVNPAPDAICQTARFGDFHYELSGVNSGAEYLLRLHFAETYHSTPVRICDVIVNGEKKLSDYDIVKESGGKMKAVIAELSVTADAQGKIVIKFVTKKDQALVNGMELLGGTAVKKKSDEAVVPKPGVPGDKIKVLILSGANNHDWKTTTPVVRDILTESHRFEVIINDTPWSMTPSDIDGYHLIFSNWNTWAKEKREWSPAMKSAFIQWVKEGGGFFVLHAGASMFYDWEEFQCLSGGGWDKDTFHPHRQEFTVNITEQKHPVTKGMKDFTIFDEPWQRVGNRNSNRCVLLTVTLPKDKGGSGNPEALCWTTDVAKGRCFNLVLGHDTTALNNPSCKRLILRGSEWAATGKVK
jgi:type 1 glutamine amidotransferase/HEAT repeat protein